MTSYFKLGFLTDEGKTVSINVYNPDKEVDNSTLKSTMDTFASCGIIETTSGTVTEAKSVQLVEVQKIEYDVSPAL